MTLHNELTANHVTYTASFTDEAARLAGTYVAADIGKSYLQVDTGVQYRLKSVSPLLFVQETGIEKTTADMEIYLDATDGNDITGTGSVSAPFKTFTRVFEDLIDKEIGHRIKIFPVADTYDEFPAYLNINFKTGGSIIIDGSKNAYPVIRADNTVDSFAGVGPQNIFGYELATELTVSPLFPPGPDPYYGLFMLFKTGNYAGKILPIHTSNDFTPNTIHTMLDWYGFSNGDTFDIVDCPVKIDIDHEIVIIGKGSNQKSEFLSIQHFGFAGIEFKSGNSTNIDKTPLYLERLNVNFSFCKLIDKYNVDDSGIPLVLSDVMFNYDFISDFYFDDNLEDYFTNGFRILSKNADPFVLNGFDIEVFNQTLGSGISRIFCRRRLLAAGRSLRLLSSFCGGISNRAASISDMHVSIQADNIVIYQIFWIGTVFDLSNCTFFCNAVYIFQGGQPVILYDHSYFRSSWFHGNLINATHALKIGWCSKFHIDLPSSGTTIDGSTGAIFWEFDQSQSLSWPSEGSFIQKAGSFVVSPGGGG